MSKPIARVIGTFTLAMITMAAIVSLRNLPLTAELGFSAVFFLILAAFVFFMPTALVVAELAAAWPRPGGCYVWVGEAFGKPLAFFSLWLTWMASVAWFPAMLAFMAAMLGHILMPLIPGLEINTTFIFITMLALLWSTTFLNFVGIEISGFFSSLGVVLGTLIPGLLVIGFGVWWVLVDNPMEIPLVVDSFVPSFKIDNLTLFVGVLYSLAGVELAAYHIREAKDPQHSYPRAVLLASMLILFVYVFGTLAIAMVVPQHDLCLESGLVQAFTCFFNKVGLAWFVPVIAFCILLGAMAGLNAWIIGPAKGMLVVAHDGFLPHWLDKVNRFGAPTRLLLVQAIFSSILGLVFLYIQNSSSSIWFLTVLSAQFTFLTYALIFCAAIRLRRTQPHVERVFRAPALQLIAGVGFLVCICCFFLVYAPQQKLVAIDLAIFGALLVASFVLLCLPVVYFIHHRRRVHHHKKH